MKAAGGIYQQTFIESYSKALVVKPNDRKIALVAADLIKDRVISFFDAHKIPLLMILDDHGTKYC